MPLRLLKRALQRRRKPQALVVDDTPEVAKLLVMHLEHMGYACQTASEARQAKQVLASAPDMDLLVIDIRLPDEHGIAFARQVRAGGSKPPTPIVFVSGAFAPEEMDRRSASSPASSALTKPFSRKTLERAVAAAVPPEHERCTT